MVIDLTGDGDSDEDKLQQVSCLSRAGPGFRHCYPWNAFPYSYKLPGFHPPGILGWGNATDKS